MIETIYIENYKGFESFTLSLNKDLNIIVGNNEAGKSTILEAVHLALTKRLGGKSIEQELTPYLFNKACSDKYLDLIRDRKNPPPPRILIELYFSETPDLEPLRGSNNSQKSDSVGIRLEIVFDLDYRDEYQKLIEDVSEKRVIPTEYYKVNWFSFGDKAITARSLPINIFHIDASTIRLQSGTDHYIQNILGDSLTVKDKVALAIAYRKLKEQFSEEPSIISINSGFPKGSITEKDLTIGIDISKKNNWETNLIPHLDELPFQLSGTGEQTALKIRLALERKAVDSDIILIEEPENHLSYSSMSNLVSKIAEKCSGKQIIITTHSAFVLNKLGIDKVLLLHGSKIASLAQLPPETYNYFKKLSGYDTLRLILAKRAILVEGPSDELVVQKAYQIKHGRLPIENGVDVINVRGLSFSRFLDIAKLLSKEVDVVTDNDGDHQAKIVDKYAQYAAIKSIRICASNDHTMKTLEPQIAGCNPVSALNKIFGTSHIDQSALVDFMTKNKTECALKIFETTESIIFPKYIDDAIR